MRSSLLCLALSLMLGSGKQSADGAKPQWASASIPECLWLSIRSIQALLVSNADGAKPQWVSASALHACGAPRQCARPRARPPSLTRFLDATERQDRWLRVCLAAAAKRCSIHECAAHHDCVDWWWPWACSSHGGKAS